MPCRFLAMIPLLLLATSAHASNFGCLASWTEVAVWLFALPVALVGSLLCAWRPWSWLVVAGGGVMTALVVLTQNCSRCHDQDASALAVIAGVVALTGLAAAVRVGVSRE